MAQVIVRNLEDAVKRKLKRRAERNAGQANEPAQHEDFAVGEIQLVEHAEYERVPLRDERIHAPEHHAIDHLFNEHPLGPPMIDAQA